jgi:hypothetical protein
MSHSHLFFFLFWHVNSHQLELLLSVQTSRKKEKLGWLVMEEGIERELRERV